MENPEWIIVDASGSREEVCEKAITELKNRKIWPPLRRHRKPPDFFQHT